MKRKKPYLLAGLVLLLFLLCTACGNTEGQIAPQDDPNEGLGGGLSEDTVNDFSGFEGIWLGEADNDYDSMEFDAEGNWTLYLSGEVVDDGYLRYEPEWEATKPCIPQKNTPVTNNNSQMYCQAENRLLNIARLNSVGQQGICLGFRHNKTRRIAADFQAQTPRRQEITAPQCLPRC